MSLDTPADKCFSNIELVTNICKFLNYEQQSKLLEVSKTLRMIIIDYVWKSKYEQVEISKIGMNCIMSNEIDFIVSNNYFPKMETYKIIRKKCILLIGNEVNKFLDLNAKNIKNLLIKAESAKEKLIPIIFPFSMDFKNLTYISYCWVSLENEDFKLLAENCKLLETLILSQCLNKKGRHLLLDADIDLQIIKSVKNLKNLIIKDHYDIFSPQNSFHTFLNIQNILKTLTLKHLALDVIISPDISKIEVDLNLCNLKSYKDLEIGSFEAPNDFIKFQNLYLQKCENLQKLSLFRSVIAKEFFDILLKSCGKLIHLRFYDCCFEDFVALPNLQEIYFESCEMSCSHLRTLLHEMNLNSFISIMTLYTGNLEYFTIRSSIQIFVLTEISRENIIETLKISEQNLRNLRKFHWEKKREELCKFNFPFVMPKLKVLYIGNPELKIEDFLDLKYLQRIVITLISRLRVSQLRKLLQQEHLRELTIWYVEECKVDVDLKGFETKLHFLDIDCKLMETISDFILELLQLNRKLFLKCRDIAIDFINEMLNNEKYPDRVESINICGFPIDCISIRNQSKNTMDFIRLILEMYRKMFELNYFII